MFSILGSEENGLIRCFLCRGGCFENYTLMGEIMEILSRVTKSCLFCTDCFLSVWYNKIFIQFYRSIYGSRNVCSLYSFIIITRTLLGFTLESSKASSESEMDWLDPVLPGHSEIRKLLGGSFCLLKDKKGNSGGKVTKSIVQRTYFVNLLGCVFVSRDKLNLHDGPKKSQFTDANSV